MGSLFQLRDYWSTALTNEGSSVAFVVGNVDNEGDADKIAVGTFDGHLQILKPASQNESNDVADVLYEQHFGEPILQLLLGDFELVTDGITQKLLAILFPRRILLARIQKYGEEVQFPKFEGSDELETLTFSVYSLEVYFESSLVHSAYNMTAGHFGRANHDLLCVQALDGHLTFLDHNKVLFSGFIPSDQFLIPGCLAYSGDRDVLLTNNSSMFLMCYQFPSLVNALQTVRDPHEDSAPPTSFTSHAQLKPTWAFNLGEDAVDIKVCHCFRSTPTKENSVVVLCPYSLYVLTSFGMCFSSRRLDVESISLAAYAVHTLNVDNLLVGTVTGSLNVYSDRDLLWSAKMPRGAPLALGVGHLCNIEGMIVTLGDDKSVGVHYLGTDPSEAPTQLLASRVQHYSDMVAELSSLHAKIKEVEGKTRKDQTSHHGKPSPSPSPSDSASPANTPAETRNAVAVKTDGFLKVELALSEVICEANSNAVDVTITLSVAERSPVDDLGDVTVQVQTTDPIAPDKNVLSAERLERGSPVQLKVRLMPKENLDGIIPSSLSMFVKASGQIHAHRTVFASAECLLPLCLIANPAPPFKSMDFSVQINTDKQMPPSLLELFKDVTPFGRIAGNVLCLNYLNGAKAMILVSKNAGRYKVQSSNMEGIWIILSELVQRLRCYYERQSQRVEFDIPDPFPLKPYVSAIQLHESVRKELENAMDELERAALFFRVVQKRLLSRFRDKNPSSTEALEVLFKESSFMIQRATDATIAGKSRLRQASAMLNACSRFIHTFLMMKYGATIALADAQLLDALFQCRVTDDMEETWEEDAFQVLIHLMTVQHGAAGASRRPKTTYSLGGFEEALQWLDGHLAAKKGLTVAT